MNRAIVIALVVIGAALPAQAQPVLTPWRPPTGCATNDVVKFNGTSWVCGSVSSFSTNNVIPKGNGTTLASSNLTDDGSTIAAVVVPANGVGTRGFNIRGTGGAASIAPNSGTLLTLENAGSNVLLSMLSTTNVKRISFGNTSNIQDGFIDYDGISRGLRFQTAGVTALSLDSGQQALFGSVVTIPTPAATIPGIRSSKAAATTVWGVGHDYDDTDFSFNYYNGTSWSEDLISISSTGALTVGDLRGTKQTYTTPTGIQTVTVNATTTVLEFNTTGLVELVGLTGGAANRVLIIRNKGTGNVLAYGENGLASAADRLYIEPTGVGGGYIVNGGGMAIAVYDATAARWHLSFTIARSTPTGLTVNGDAQSTGSLTSATSTTVGTALTVGGTATLNGHTIIGDSTADVLTINATLNGNGIGNSGWAGKHAEWTEEFLRMPIANTVGQLLEGLMTYTSAVGCTVVGASSGAYPGVTNFTPGSTGNSCVISWGSDNANRNILFMAGTTWTVDAAIAISQSSNNASGRAMHFLLGAAENAGTTNPTSGCFFAYDDRNTMTGATGAADAGKYECWCGTASTFTKYLMDGSVVSDGGFTTVNAPVSFGGGTFDHLRLVMTGNTLVEFFVNGVKSCQITTNLPSGSGHGPFMRAAQNSGSGALQSVNVDLFRVAFDLTTARGAY